MHIFYHIQGLCPDGDIGGAGFTIQLWPAWKQAVAELNLDQDNINKAILNMGRVWLDGCGYNRRYDPENPDNPGPNAGYLYEPRTALRISWGEWGPEHITVPGNACGLDLDDGIGKPRNGKVLLPHNVDHIRQAHLLLVVFLFFADTLVLDQQIKNLEGW